MGMLGLYDYSIINSGWLATAYADYPPAYRAACADRPRVEHRAIGSTAATRVRRSGCRQCVIWQITSGRLTKDKNQTALTRR